MLGIADFAGNVTWFLPGTVLSIVAGYVLRHRVARFLGGSDALGWALVVAIGIIAAATLTPLREGTGEAPGAVSGCDFSRVGFASIRVILRGDDPLRNIVLFMPLGAVLAFVPGRLRKTTLLATAGLTPVFIEVSQLVLTPLHRACQSADVFDNDLGLLIGFAVGAGLGAMVASIRDRTGEVA